MYFKKAVFILCLFNINITAQVITPQYILGGVHDSVRKFTVPKSKTNLVLNCGFNKSNFDVGLLDSIGNKSIDTILLVYTAFRQAESFNQSDLNVLRLNVLQQNMPYIFENNLIQWKVVRQTGAKNDQEAKAYFHGFVIKFKNDGLVTPLTTAKEILFIKEYLRSLRGILPTDTFPGDLIKDFEPKIGADTFTVVDTLIRYPLSKRIIRYIDINLVKNDYRKAKRYTKLMVDIDPEYKKRLTRIILDTSNLKIKHKPLYYIPKSKRKVKKGILYTRKTILNRELAKDTLFIRRREFYTGISGGSYPVYLYDGHLTFTPEKFVNFKFADSVVTVSLKMSDNHADNVLVEDVTGSMYPYILQTFLWRRLYISKAKLRNFVFFNDGDRTPDRSKVIGNTKGIYSISTDSILEVEELVYSTMSKGNGGDSPENNIEALIYAQEKFPDKNLIMIADNNALVKDITLLDKITRPVHVIVCGAQRGVMANYITIASKTGGKLTTIEKTYYDLKNIQKGDKITIGGQTFVMTATGLQLIR